MLYATPMAIIDTFLHLMVNQKADKLRIRPDDVPTIFKTDDSIRLSMPPVSADMVRMIAIEVVGDENAETLKSRSRLEGKYKTSGHGEFNYRITARGGGFEIEMSLAINAKIETETDPKVVPPLPALEVSDTPPKECSQNERTPEDDPEAVQYLDIASKTKTDDAPTPISLPHPDGRPDASLSTIIAEALRLDASDIFLSTGKTPHVRINGAMEPMDRAVTRRAQIEQIIPNERLRAELEQNGSADFGITLEIAGTYSHAAPTQRFRVNVFHHAHGLAAALRPVRSRIPTLEALHLPRELYQLCGHNSGLVLVTGASGSGKSTTLAALLEHINQTESRHIITIEDPIEFEHQSKRSLIHQREVATHVKSFGEGLRAALRENPDVILLGEMRDPATISAALTASETGHLVFSTLHTGNATSSINRIIDAFPGHQQPHVRIQIAASLRAVVAQRLVPSIDNQRRLPAVEKLIVTHAVANLIREGREHQVESAIQTGGEDGMMTLERSLAPLVRNRQISRSTAFKYAENRFALQKLLGE